MNDTARTVEGSPAKSFMKSGNRMVDSANAVKTDIVRDNGVVHVIDAVIMPGM